MQLHIRLCTIIADTTLARFRQTPVNTHHTLGSSKVLRLNCSVRFVDRNTKQLEWVGRTQTDTLATQSGTVAPQWRHKYEIQGDFDLVFKDPELSDAGKYECRTSSGFTQNLRHSALVFISGETIVHFHCTLFTYLPCQQTPTCEKYA